MINFILGSFEAMCMVGAMLWYVGNIIYVIYDEMRGKS